jgi:ammonia channel protein AmtB
MLHLDTGNTGFMILCTSLVMLMTPAWRFSMAGWWAAKMFSPS